VRTLDTHARRLVLLPGSLLLAVSGLLGVCGFGFEHWGLPTAFDLDEELVVPSFWSGGLLAGATVAAGAVWRSTGRRWALGLCGVFAYMACDETIGIHEWLERTTGVDWQILLLPLAAAGGVGWLGALRAAWRHGPVTPLLLGAGAAAWFGAQVLEALQWDGTRHAAHYYLFMYPEEVGEMVGSACFLVALFALARAARAHA
jgi:hypothetical protein